MHEEALKIRRAADEEAVETGLVHVTSLGGATVTDLGLGDGATEATTQNAIYTLGRANLQMLKLKQVN